MPNSCHIKNPCKICFKSVTTKTGIQCQGACRTWAHYTCLNYSPGKILDLKCGYIKIICPCPSCGIEPIEIKTNTTYKYDGDSCPVPIPEAPKCRHVECPSNDPGNLKSKTAACPIPPPPSIPKAQSPPPCKPKPLTDDCCPFKSSSEDSMQENAQSLYQPPSCNGQCYERGNLEKTSEISEASLSSSSCDSQMNIGQSSSSMLKLVTRMCTTVSTLSEQLRIILEKMSNVKGKRNPDHCETCPS